ncbi:uncharacterized protein LOC131941857 [Physella acuta]|uniref:uncharacterized protein LOC131941857 n=1 Tax=Physella acuta TaxID=109671 RepID=UPI0027DC5465|nr:uncharacterized protein LOC131941857 [Physella acuta]
MILSGTCLTLTLVTYAMFSELRSEAGKTNIMLCVSLLLATVIVMAKAYITKLGIICTTLGVASHFMWLWMLMWMFLGTFQMFKIFSASTRNMNSDPYQNHLLMRKLVISFLPPLVIVGAVIVKSLIESDGDVIGYGLNGCFIDSNSSVVMFLIAPVVAATVVNSGLFAATTYNIHKVRRVQASDFTQRTHGMFLVYVKLSTLTGITFVLDFIAFMLDSDVMWIISILLTGLQGVFIFLSFTCNKRVLDLYVKLCRDRGDTASGISPRIANISGNVPEIS